MTNVSFGNILINFGFGTKEEKHLVLEKNKDKKVFIDLTCYDPKPFYEKHSNLGGVFSALFCDERKKIEIHFRTREEAVLEKLKELGFSPVETTILSCGFVFPRTIVQIINEAHFALEEKVASREDIDRAMKFGVNYPKGPFEWSNGREIYAKALLNELLAVTNDQRYMASSLL